MTNDDSNNQSKDREQWGKYGESLFRHWVRTYGNRYTERWLKKHKYDIKSLDTKEFITYMTDCFIDWILRDK